MYSNITLKNKPLHLVLSYLYQMPNLFCLCGQTIVLNSQLKDTVQGNRLFFFLTKAITGHYSPVLTVLIFLSTITITPTIITVHSMLKLVKTFFFFVFFNLVQNKQWATAKRRMTMKNGVSTFV